jgi:eukaryotic-like serine/threonine-protein kinase
MIGRMLGPYRILEKLGAGGMGEVYKARDTRLDRTVAIKILPADLSADPDRRARFEREAKTIAGLSHPHICALFDVGHETPTGGEGVAAAPGLPRPQALDSARAESRGGRPIEGARTDSEGVGAAPSGRPIDFLVMEHLEGETLAHRIEKGPLPLDQALAIATDIADALAAAHRQGVIHRDLKPANVMLTKTGAAQRSSPHAKLLDFGLAKLTGHGEQPAAASLASLPTRSRPLTGEGTIVGTLQYMAPEQVEGKPADARTDLWALGAILYEMLTGRRAFEGASAASLIGNIMNAEPPPLAGLQPLTPPGVDRLVRRCLAKDPDERWASAHDVAEELRWMRQASDAGAPAGAGPRRSRRSRTALLVAGLAGAAALGAAAAWVLGPAPPRAPVARVRLDLGPAEELNGGGVIPVGVLTPGGTRTALAWTPDGQALVFVGRRGGAQQLYVRRLDAAEARPLAGTLGAQAPAVSPDGQWVAFWADGAIRKVPLGGGPVTDLAPDVGRSPFGLSWGPRGDLYLGRDDGRIWVVPAQGAPAAVTSVGDAEVRHVLPWPVPNGRAILYTVRKRIRSWGDEEVVAQDLRTGARTPLLGDAADARLVASGHLVFLRRGTLWAAPFDVERLELGGAAVALFDGVAQALKGGNPYDQTGAGQFAVAPTGTLAWLTGSPAPYDANYLVTVDRRGAAVRLPAPARAYSPGLRLSPDGRQLSVGVDTLTERSLWIYDLARGTLTPLTRDGEVQVSSWSPDGRRLALAWLNLGRRSLAVQPADASAPAQAVAAGDLIPSTFASDGRRLVAVRGGRAIVTVDLGDGQARVEPLLETPHTAGWPEFSPDGRWLAFASNVSGRFEVYVTPYPGPWRATQVSIDSGKNPMWNPNGRELFFVTDLGAATTGSVMAATFAPGPTAADGPRIGRPQPLFGFDAYSLAIDCAPVRCFDVAPDGQRFYAVQVGGGPKILPAVTYVSLVQNWFEELRAKVPIK